MDARAESRLRRLCFPRLSCCSRHAAGESRNHELICGDNGDWLDTLRPRAALLITRPDFPVYRGTLSRCLFNDTTFPQSYATRLKPPTTAGFLMEPVSTFSLATAPDAACPSDRCGILIKKSLTSSLRTWQKRDADQQRIRRRGS